MKIQNLITGKFFENDKLRNRAIVFIFVVIIGLVNLYSKFWSVRLYRELTIVKKELGATIAEHAVINAKKVSITRESNLLRLIDKNNIDLIKQSDPPIPIKQN